jgi:hypothetical protein
VPRCTPASRGPSSSPRLGMTQSNYRFTHRVPKQYKQGHTLTLPPPSVSSCPQPTQKKAVHIHGLTHNDQDHCSHSHGERRTQPTPPPEDTSQRYPPLGTGPSAIIARIMPETSQLQITLRSQPKTTNRTASSGKSRPSSQDSGIPQNQNKKCNQIHTHKISTTSTTANSNTWPSSQKLTDLVLSIGQVGGGLPRVIKGTIPAPTD